ncbi:sodium/glucose cotransporter [Photobacterium sanctipauli]|uniref:Sodium/glucose cotransporter n=2 Tax=Photobacterium sanctipauli TaxID=1342794 RepID=A0A2T3NWY4_9GAMM|nr:sodium/solute symporter [Photobacterium sanctipauli]PSW20794.1 sodium/glucose cotransporter [Photobacterium sanctipauli]
MIDVISTLDYAVFAGYIGFIVIIGTYLGKQKGGSKNAKTYFLAGNSLPWWAVGTGMIAANISAEQLIGTTGSGYAMGIAISSWEWVAIPAILLAAKYTVPYFIKHNILTMPQFLEQRYDSRIRTLFAAFWVVVYVFINLTAVSYMGALALQSIMGIPLGYGIVGMMAIALLYSFVGGFASIAWTNFIQVTVLVIAGLITTWLAMEAVTEHLQTDSIWHSLAIMKDTAPEHMSIAISEDNPNFQYIPGGRTLVGGMWVICIFGWCFNQFIVQNTLAAKNTREAQKGLLFAAILKLFMPIILVIPGIAAYILTKDTQLLTPADKAYPWLINNFIPTGVKGIVLAALAAAIISTLSALLNSAATLFTVDIYQARLRPKATDKESMFAAKVFMLTSACLSAALAQPMLVGMDQAYQFIQEFIGFVMPGMLTIFLFGILWVKATSNGAIIALFLSVAASLVIRLALPDLPHLDRTGIVFLICSGAMLMSCIKAPNLTINGLVIDLKDSVYRTSREFNIGGLLLIGSLFTIYWKLW